MMVAETKPIWYAALEKFSPANGESWDNYIEWARLPHLTEVVSLDSMLCPNLVDELNEEDWEHNVQEHFRIGFFQNLDYLLQRVGEAKQCNLLAVMLEPENDVSASLDLPNFRFCGYDLVEQGSGISALANCGGFDKVFRGSDLSKSGLLEDYGLATQIQRELVEQYPEEVHAECDLWAIWRIEKE